MVTQGLQTLQVALPTNPTDADIWYDLTFRLRENPCARGREGIDSAVSAGTIRPTLDNADRALDPSHTGSPYYSWLKVGRRCRTGVAITDGASSFTGAVRDRGPIAGWILGEPIGTALAYDQVGGVTGHHGTYTGGAGLEAAGLVDTGPDTSASFDGTNDYVEIPDWSGADLAGNAPFSILAVFAPAVIDTTYRRLVDKESSSGGRNGWAFGYQSADGLFISRLLNGTEQRATAPASFLTANQPNVVLATYDGATLRLYVAGVLRGSAASAQSISATTQVVALGRSTVFGGYLSGRLGHVWLFDRALSAADAADLYAASQGSYEPRFEGYLDPFSGTREGFSGARVEFPASDGLSVLANADVSGSRPEEKADVRIGAVLDSAQWTTGDAAWILGHPTLSILGSTTIPGPRGARALDPASATLQAVELDGTALPHLQDAERSEQGLYFISRTGEATLHNRQRRVLAGLQPPRAVFGDRPFAGELPFVDVVLEDGTELYNTVSVSRRNGETHTVSDAASQLQHWKRAMPGFSVSVATEGDAEAIARYKLHRHKDQRKRIRQLVLDPAAASGGLWPTLMQVIFGSELGDLYEVRVRPPGGGDPIVALVHLEHLSEHWVFDQQSARWGPIVWTLSEADPGPWWVLGDPLHSVLGVNTVPSWLG